MSAALLMDGGSRKKRRISNAVAIEDDDSGSDLCEISAAEWKPTTRRMKGNENDRHRSTSSISPPPKRNMARKARVAGASGETYMTQSPPAYRSGQSQSAHGPGASSFMGHAQALRSESLKASPIQLSTVNGLAASSNVDTVSLRDILGDPLIKECWLFNYLIDVDYIMSQFDEDTRDLVQVKIVHGSWKTEDGNRIRIEEAAERYKNVQPVIAYMAEMYGTHHSKMIILFRHDDQAQVVIVTGNFITQDWSMCQAVWRSPYLPLLGALTETPGPSGTLRIGSGGRFKSDLLAYLKAYGSKRTGPLTAELDRYDFSFIKAALVASVPGKQNLRSTDPETETLWGWPGLRHLLSSIVSTPAETRPSIVMQCSSVATLAEKWMVGTFLKTLAATQATKSSLSKQQPKCSLVFPTADEIRRSVEGYSSGGSIHMKTQTPAQLKQLTFLRPMLCHWAGDVTTASSSASTSKRSPVREALRRRAAPHIKTYIRFSDEDMTRIDWALMTSANLSKQAWGEAATAGGEVRICSYEIGVLVWPDLWDEGEGAEMVPVFGKDMPDDEGVDNAEFIEGNAPRELDARQKVEDDEETTDEEGGGGIREGKSGEPKGRRIRVGLRMPYDLPLVPYARDEMPWCASTPCAEPDWMGRVWPGFERS
ncbi:MAG: hypothetical protein Q9184_007324 [Pyrenodesmia sp. 2 TL-2023]